MCTLEKQLRKQPTHIQEHYYDLCRKLEVGIGLRELGAKQIERFKRGARRFSVRLSKSHRMVVLITRRGPIPEWIGTHQEYDKWLVAK